jgi:predicted GNAT family acetyltransferase
MSGNEPGAEPSILVRDNAERARYEISVDGDLAGFADYRDRAGRRIFVHTEVDRAFAGRGLANRLASGALDDAMARRLRVVPRCPFIRAFVERHAEYRAALAQRPD